MFALLADPVQQLWGEKPVILLSAKISLTNLYITSIDVPLYGFLVVIMNCLLSNSTTTFHCE